MRVMMVLSYDGSKFYGFQRQKDVRNVQSYLERYLSHILEEDIVVKGAGRTDRGVHAYHQVVHFDTNNSIKGLKKKLNHLLKDCHINNIKIVNNDFHARYSVVNKVYLYKIDLTGKRDNHYYLNYKNNLDIHKMRECAKGFIGTHNFKNFVSGKRDNYESTINKVKIYKINNVLFLKFIGVGFYRYMVRNIVGALLMVGNGKINICTIKDMLNKPEQEKRLTTVSPNGLYLVNIKYK